MNSVLAKQYNLFHVWYSALATKPGIPFLLILKSHWEIFQVLELHFQTSLCSHLRCLWDYLFLWNPDCWQQVHSNGKEMSSVSGINPICIQKKTFSEPINQQVMLERIQTSLNQHDDLLCAENIDVEYSIYDRWEKYLFGLIYTHIARISFGKQNELHIVLQWYLDITHVYVFWKYLEKQRNCGKARNTPCISSFQC